MEEIFKQKKVIGKNIDFVFYRFQSVSSIDKLYVTQKSNFANKIENLRWVLVSNSEDRIEMWKLHGIVVSVSACSP